MPKTNKIVEVAGIKLPLTSYGSDQHQNILCKDSNNFYPFSYANLTQASNKVLKLSDEGIESHIVYPRMFARGFNINIIIGV